MNYDSVPLRDFKELNDWETVIFVYQSALKQVETKIDILNGEFQHRHKYNPIEHVKSRIKTPESIVKKLKRHGYESSIENMVRYVNDIAGIRISCSFTSDIYLIADMISKQNDLTQVVPQAVPHADPQAPLRVLILPTHYTYSSVLLPVLILKHGQ